MIKEYGKGEDQLSHYLVWGYFLEEGILLNKNGSLQKTYEIRGTDLDTSTTNELKHLSHRLNNVFARLEDFTFHIEARRSRSNNYAKSEFLNEIPLKIIEYERKSFFEGGNHYESRYFFTITYLPPTDSKKKILDFFIEKVEVKKNIVEESIKFFKKKTLELYIALEKIFVDFKDLNTKETVTYLHSQVSEYQGSIKPPQVDMLLDSYVCDTQLIGGLDPILGSSHLRTISLYSFPQYSYMGILDSLNRLNIEYRWVTRFITLDKQTALKNLEIYHRKWFANRKSFKQLIFEVFSNKETFNVNETALSNAQMIKNEKICIEQDITSMGYYTSTIVLTNKDKSKLEKDSQEVIKIINGLEFTAFKETFNSLEAWMGTLSGDLIHNIRKPMINSINLINLLPFSAIWGGEEENKHLKQPSLLYTQTTGNTPFRFNIHQGDIGHTMLVGKTGSGKSVHLNTLACQFMKYKKAQVFIFDKGKSSQVLTRAMNGKFYDLGSESLGFQPFAKIGAMEEKEFIKDWVEAILLQENFKVQAQHKATIWEAIEGMIDFPKNLRTFSTFVSLIQDQELKQVFDSYIGDGAYGKYFDCNYDSLEENKFQSFELEKVANKPLLIAPLLQYLFHRIEKDRLNGSPTLLVLDECWLFFNNPIFEAKIEEWLRVLRKANASVVFATQELHDIEKSNISDIIKNSCQTKIYLPNSEATTNNNKEIYYKFGLNEREVEILSLAEPKQDYYYKCSKGNRLYQLALSNLELAYVASSSKDDLKKVEELNNLICEDFNIEWLNYKGYDGKKVIENIKDF